MASCGLVALDELPAAKAQLARELTLGGQRLRPEQFAARGLHLSRAQAAWVAQWDEAGLSAAVAECVASADGTRRLVLRLGDGETVETVVMASGAVCVSTQVGCAVGCRFCASGRDGLRRNLTTAEILEQVAQARRQRRIDRVVFMGMGEPSHNLDAVLAAVAALKSEGRISPRRQTVSTVGSTRAFARMAEREAMPCLALSLHSADPVRRAALLPHAPREPLPDLLRGADAYARRCGTPVQIEWTVLAGVNDGDDDVDALCALVAGVRGYVNFIVWNEVDGLPFERPQRQRVIEMVRRAKRHGVFATIRDSAGADVAAACGQLRGRRLGAVGA